MSERTGGGATARETPSVGQQVQYCWQTQPTQAMINATILQVGQNQGEYTLQALLPRNANNGSGGTLIFTSHIAATTTPNQGEFVVSTGH